MLIRSSLTCRRLYYFVENDTSSTQNSDDYVIYIRHVRRYQHSESQKTPPKTFCTDKSKLIPTAPDDALKQNNHMCKNLNIV